MKRNSMFLVILFALILVMQTACNRYVPDEKNEESSSDIVAETQTETDESIETSAAEPVSEADILDNREALDDKGILWYVPNERIEEGVQQQILWYNGDLLVWGSGLGTDGEVVLEIAILSMETGDVLFETSFSDLEIPNVQVCGELVAVTDWADGDICLLDNELQIVKEYQQDVEYCTLYLNPDASKVYCFTQDEGVRITDIYTEESETVLENTSGLYASGCSGKIASVSYTDRTTQFNFSGIVDLETGEVQNIPFSGVFFGVEYSDGVWLAGAAGDTNTYYLGRAERPKTFSIFNGSSIVSMLNSPARLLVTAYDMYGNSAVTLYDIDGNFVSECNIPAEWGGLFNEPLWSKEKGGYFFTVTEATGKDVLLFWDLSTPVMGEALQFGAVYSNDTIAGTAVAQSLYDRAGSISETYGVDVKIAEQSEDVYDDFTIEKEYDEVYISAGLDSLETVLTSYPAGFMEQLLYGDQKKIEIVLTGHLTKNTLDENALGFTSFAGFAQEQPGRTIIVVDITNPGSLEQTLYHEIMHLIDNKLAFDAGVRADAVYSEEYWMSLNPEDFEYAESYNELPMSIYTDGYEEWFIDIYSRTFATEDRARIMEYAMAGHEWIYSASPGRLAKLEYLCECIRDAFDTAGWPEKTIWEETLEKCR